MSPLWRAAFGCGHRAWCVRFARSVASARTPCQHGPVSPSALPRFDFEAPDDHLAYYAEIAVEMMRRWRVALGEAVAAVTEGVSEVDHFGQYSWLLFHEDPWYWADLYYHLHVVGDEGYRPGCHWDLVL
jgi:hypothetical protein